MTSTRTNLRSVRKRRGWNQQDVARHLGVSQTLVSLWEHGKRKFPTGRLQRLRQLGVEVDATELPMRNQQSLADVDYAQELSNMGYPGFAHFQTGEPSWNPAQLLVKALSEHNLDRRVVEALPWLVLRYSEMDWNWVRREAKLRDLQNRLGFTLALARKLAVEKQRWDVAGRLGQEGEALLVSLLAKEDTYCYDGMTPSERKWLQTRRSHDATTWHILSDLETAHLRHV